METIMLRPYQEDAINTILTELETAKKKILIELATGTGKTQVIIQLIKQLCIHNEKKILVLVSRLEVRSQLQSAFRKADIFVSLESPQRGVACTLMTYSKFRKDLIKPSYDLPSFQFIICFDAEDAKSIEPNNEASFLLRSVLIGFSSALKPLKGWFQGVAPSFRYSIEDGIKEGYLSELSDSKYYESAAEGFCRRLFKEIGVVQAKPAVEHLAQVEYPDLILSGSSYQIIVEIKAYRSKSVSIPALNQSVSQMVFWRKNFRCAHSEDKYCLIMFCEVPLDLKQQIYEKQNITVWDISNLLYLVQNSPELLNDLIKLTFFNISDVNPVAPVGWNPHIYAYASALLTDEEVAKELESRLKSCKIGKTAYMDYEEICSDIILYLFSNEFTIVSKQHKTNDELFRMDMLCTLKGSSSFWDFLIQHYNSRFVVFEYKNYRDKLSQNLIFVTEKYLFNAALRNVAVIISRKGFSPNATSAAIGCLKENGKLVIELTDQDLIAMLNKKTAGGEPADYMLTKLENLLMSISK